MATTAFGDEQLRIAWINVGHLATGHARGHVLVGSGRRRRLLEVVFGGVLLTELLPLDGVLGGDFERLLQQVLIDATPHAPPAQIEVAELIAAEVTVLAEDYDLVARLAAEA